MAVQTSLKGLSNCMAAKRSLTLQANIRGAADLAVMHAPQEFIIFSELYQKGEMRKGKAAESSALSLGTGKRPWSTGGRRRSSSLRYLVALSAARQKLS